MMTLTIPDDIAQQLNIVAQNSKVTPTEFVLSLLKNAINQQNLENEEADALLIHEQLMEQYADTFQKLAQ